ncbi:DUF1992 domain-containing protein [Armatimonas sp.]|uniref:DnaJ family domain-containing protein n=1 Tax=Armatimonas sp. TaxID=1872638 RepID=UPI00286A0C1B|nr:DUF1992 domain-containing protein [Armatimonas sp.]
MDWMRIIGEGKIKEAMNAGDFDNNPLKGKPINYEQDAGLSPELRAMKTILKNARVRPEWMDLESDIRREQAAVAQQKTRAVAALAKASDASRERVAARIRVELKEAIGVVNTMILHYNMTCPPGHAQAFRSYVLASELESLGL